LPENKENEDPCPICQNNLGFEWYVLVCGHSYCKDCMFELKKNEDYNCQKTANSLRCPICRELCKDKESYLVTTKNIKPIEKEEKPTLLGQISDKFECNDLDYLDYNTNELSKIKIKV
jgi:hypothetical protein